MVHPIVSSTGEVEVEDCSSTARLHIKNCLGGGLLGPYLHDDINGSYQKKVTLQLSR